jgi:hypothetical protein
MTVCDGVACCFFYQEAVNFINVFCAHFLYKSGFWRQNVITKVVRAKIFTKNGSVKCWWNWALEAVNDRSNFSIVTTNEKLTKLLLLRKVSIWTFQKEEHFCWQLPLDQVRSDLWFSFYILYYYMVNYLSVVSQGEDSQNFLRKFIRFFVTLRCFYAVDIHGK